MDITFREISEKDMDFLWEMVYQAIFVREGQEKPSREILNEPNIKKYVEHWGRVGDFGIIAVDSGLKSVGAVWGRLFQDHNATFGYVDDDTPVLTMAVLPSFRGNGIGTYLLEKMTQRAIESGYSKLSLSVDPDNPILRLYKRNGFEKVGENGTSWDMVAKL